MEFFFLCSQCPAGNILIDSLRRRELSLCYFHLLLSLSIQPRNCGTTLESRQSSTRSRVFRLVKQLKERQHKGKKNFTFSRMFCQIIDSLRDKTLKSHTRGDAPEILEVTSSTSYRCTLLPVFRQYFPA